MADDAPAGAMLRRGKLTGQRGKGYTSAPLLAAATMNAKLRKLSRPVRTVLRWQVMATTGLTLLAGALAGAHGALSAALGGLVIICAGLGFAVAASVGKAESMGGTLLAAFRAEIVKVGLVVILLWLVLATYKSVVVAAFIGSFAATVLISAMAFFVREY
jgi:ATP synthase protein I